VHKVDPLARQVGKSSEVLGRREPLRLEASHLTRRSRAALRRFAADNPAHSRIVAQALGVVHILVSRQGDRLLASGAAASVALAAPGGSVRPGYTLGALARLG